jgi:hypothetical protein
MGGAGGAVATAVAIGVRQEASNVVAASVRWLRDLIIAGSDFMVD